MQSFSLPLSNFKQLNFNNYVRDFDFIYDHETFSCNKIIADFLSPIVNHIHRTDPTLDHFEIPNDKHYPPPLFKLIIDSAELKDIQITKENAEALKYFYSKLGNKDFDKFVLCNETPVINKDSAFNLLYIKMKLGVSVNQEVEFIASHLYELDDKMETETENGNLTVDILRMIFGSSHIKIKNEDWLFNYIMKWTNKKSSEFICLFEYVKFRCLSEKSVKTFFKSVPLDELNQSVYDAIIDLTMNGKQSNPSNSSRYKDPESDAIKKKEEEKKKEEAKNKKDEDKNENRGSIQRILNFDGHHPLSGIFSFLTQTVSNGQNIATAGIVDITSSSINSTSNNSDLKHLVDFNSSTYFISNNEPNQWITFDFKERRVLPRFYTLVTHDRPRGSDHMKSWAVEVSDDNVHYTVITAEQNNTTLNNRSNLAVFRVANPTRYGRYVRIRQTGPNWWNSDILALAQVELFGILVEADQV